MLNYPPNRFRLPSEGLFKPNGPDDPLPYYYKPFIGKLYQARIEQALSLLTPPYESILEIGYGSGILLPSLKEMCSYLTGVDLQPIPKDLVETLETMNLPCSLIEGDINNNRLSESSFNLIIAISVLEHIADLESVIKQIVKLLKPSGHLLVGMPRVDSFMEKAFRMIGYSEIRNHHVSGHEYFLEEASSHFNLTNASHIPKVLPKSLGLYFNMLLEKKV